MEVIGRRNPLEVVSELFEGVCEALDVACAVVEEVEAHGGAAWPVGRKERERRQPFWKRREERSSQEELKSNLI